MPAALRRRHVLLLAVLAVTAAGMVLAPGAMASAITLQHGGSPNADRINSLYVIALVLGLVVFLGVEGALLYSIVKFRAKRGAVAAQIRGNTPLEIGWTVGAAVILVILSVITFAKLGAIRDRVAGLDAGADASDGGSDDVARGYLGRVAVGCRDLERLSGRNRAARLGVQQAVDVVDGVVGALDVGRAERRILDHHARRRSAKGDGEGCAGADSAGGGLQNRVGWNG